MFISMNWISDFVDFTGLDKLDLIHRFSLSTAEVENEIFMKGSDIHDVVVGQICSVENHPESQKLHLLKVDIGAKEPVDVVCGAPNVRVGMKTAFAKVGASVLGLDITPRELAGYTSYGMCCSEKELGLSDNHAGIMELDNSFPVGKDLKEIFEIDDIIFEVDNKSLTNRPDLWGHYGMAREFAALAKRPLKPIPQVDLEAYKDLPAIDMKILDKLCQRYSCLKIDNVNVKVSPVNMRIRLFYCGMRAINLMADLTNYLMLEMGQPMHAFDSRKVEKIRIRRFEKPFVFKTLDGVDRNIDENTLMICNDEEPVAIAGIMGGLASEIVDDTTALTLESATFDAVSIRKSTVRLTHRTDASMRYEKCLDPSMTVPAIARFVYLLKEIDPGVKVISSLTDEIAFTYPTIELTFDKPFVDKYTGIDISIETIEKTLKDLGFRVALTGDTFKVVVPSWRSTKDVTMKADIIEEITRIYGYDNFEINTANAPLYPIRISKEKSTENKIKDVLVKEFDLHEVHSYIWALADDYKKLGLPIEDNVKLLNASNPNIETLRHSMIPTQLVQIRQNLGYADDYGIFEIGHTVDGVDDNNLCREYKKLGITLLCRSQSLEDTYFRLRDILAVTMMDTKHKTLSFRAKTPDHEYIHPKNCNEILVDGIAIGEMGIIHPTIQKKIDKKAAIVYAELDVKAWSEINADGIRYQEPSKYPGMEVDVTFLTGSFRPIQKAIETIHSEFVKKVQVADIYHDGGQTSLTVRLTFSCNDRTLTRENDVQPVVDTLIAQLSEVGIPLKM